MTRSRTPAVMKMHRVRLPSMPIVAAAITFSASAAGGVNQQGLTILAECPALLMTHSGGLGTEATGGVLVAVWESGYILRARSQKRPSGAHVLGRLESSQVETILRVARESRLWTIPSGGVAVDYPSDEIELQRGGQRVGWAETPGENATPELEALRAELFKLRIRQPLHALDHVETKWTCPPVRWSR